MKVQGRVRTLWGENCRKRKTSGEVNSVMSRSSTTALAMMRRPTHGVIRYEGDDFIRRMPLQLDPRATRDLRCGPAEPHDRSVRTARGNPCRKPGQPEGGG